MNEIKISVIIPAYNEEKNLPKIIGSLRKQTGKNFKIIVVDNNSTDRTFKVAKKLADKVYECKEQGISPARNMGARKAKSEIVAFLDADSLALPGWASAIENAFKNNKDLSLVSGLDVYEYDNFIKRMTINLYSYIAFLSCKSLTFFGKPTIQANNLAIKRAIFNKVGGFDNLIAEDYYFSLKLRKLKNIRCRVDSRMKVELSSRRLKKSGLIKTMWTWIVSIVKEVHSDTYTLHDKL
jgi:glycosyltransferase involved in cell wall biosynthesis